MIKRDIDLLEIKLLAIGFSPALMARGPTAIAFGLAVSALMSLSRKIVREHVSRLQILGVVRALIAIVLISV